MLSCVKIADCSHCFCKPSWISNFGCQHDRFLLKLCDNLFNRHHHSSIDPKQQLATRHKTTPNTTPSTKRLPWLLLRQKIAVATVVISTTSSCVFPRRHSATTRVRSHTTSLLAFRHVTLWLNSKLSTPQQQTNDNPASNANHCYAAIMIDNNYFSWIVFLTHSSAVRVSNCGHVQRPHLSKTVALKAYCVSVHAVHCHVIVDKRCEASSTFKKTCMQ